MTSNITTDILRTYIEANEVVYQFRAEFMDVSNDTEKESKETLLDHFRKSNSVEVYTKHNRCAKDDWPELTDWSAEDNGLLLLDGVGVLICIQKKKLSKTI